MVLLGGFGILGGPVIGAILFTYLKLYAMSYTQYWMFVIGGTFIILVMLLPTGVAGAAVDLWNKFKAPKTE
jgi:branched-chain amino acid transport system permease protein